MKRNFDSKIYEDVMKIFEKTNWTSIQSVAEKLGISRSAAKCRLRKLVKQGKLERIARGLYCLKGESEKLKDIVIKSFCVRVPRTQVVCIPCTLVKKLGIMNEPVQVVIARNNNKKETFICNTRYRKETNQTLMYINNTVIEKLGIQIGDVIKVVEIKKIPQQRPTKIFVGNKIDLMSLVPKRTRKGFEIFVVETENGNEKSILVWYKGAEQIQIKRYVDAKLLGYLLGQLQAEGSKYKKIKKTSSPTVVFTSKLLGENVEFTRALQDLGVQNNLMKARCYYNPNNFNEDRAKNIMRKFTSLTGIPIKECKLSNKKVWFTIQVAVERSVLGEILLNAMDILRQKIVESGKFTNGLRELAEGFLTKLLIGDGTLNIYRCKSRRNTFVINGYISDGDPEYRRDYRKILRKFNISAASYDEDGRVYFRCNKENLKFFYNIKAFLGTKNWIKLLIAIFLSRIDVIFYKRLKKLAEFPVFSTKDIENLFNLSANAARNWVMYQRKRGYINVKENKEIPLFTLTKKAFDLLNLLTQCENELRNLTGFEGDLLNLSNCYKMEWGREYERNVAYAFD
jgi:DNA-binding Lrp family transcriptional regulator